MKSISAIASLSATGLLLLALSGCVGAKTVAINVQNDLKFDATLSVCDDDPVRVAQGQTVTVLPLLASPNAACLVYRFDGASYVGCLSLPKEQREDGDRVRLSQMSTTTSESDCGK